MINNISTELRNASGIYEIRNLANGKVYVGSTVNFGSRMRGHKHDLLKNRCCNVALHRAVLKHGIDNFSINVLHHVKRNENETKSEFTKRLLRMEYESIMQAGADCYNIKNNPEKDFSLTKFDPLIDAFPPSPNQSIGANNINAVIDEGKARQIKLMLYFGIAVPCVANLFSLKQGIIWNIKYGLCWKYIELTECEISNFKLPEIKSVRTILNDEDVKKVKFLSQSKVIDRFIAEFLGLSYGVVKAIRQGRRYKKVLLLNEDKIRFEKSDLLKKFNQFL